MPGHKIHTLPRSILFLCFIVILILAHLLLRLSTDCLYAYRQPELRVEGRWKAVRYSLGLPPLPDRIKLPHGPQAPSIPPRITSRFDLKNKRAAELAAPAQLFFSPDALQEQSLTNEELLESFYAVALREKENAAEVWRVRGPRNLRNHRPQSRP